jgi:hypothetical protein
MLGAQEGNFFEIMDGLKGTETLAASNLNEITTGMKVTVADTTSTPAPARNEQAAERGAQQPAPQEQEGQKRNGGARRGFGGN